MPTRSSLALAATVLAAVATVVASQDGDADIVPFFVGLTVAGGIGAWAMHEPFTGRRQYLGRLIAGLWLIAAVWIGGLLLMYQMACGCSGPVPPPEATYLGLTATIYHLVAVYMGGALMAVAAFSRRLAPA
ncbi:MAG: hypothetical protein M3Y40_01130 [Chloroflexota bacterium]|nr:hypothetical protein [Chloroflexota bacterium]